jgi:hypothetical protein
MATADAPALLRAPLTSLSEEEAAFRDAVTVFAVSDVQPRVAAMERAGKIDIDLIAKCFGLGLMGIEVEERYGGSSPSRR